MTPEASAPTISIDPWLAVSYPLSVQELTRLSHPLRSAGRHRMIARTAELLDRVDGR